MMKHLLVTLASVLFGLVALPQKAEAGHKHCGTSYTFKSGHSHCGCPKYKRRVIVSYDCHNHPVYRYYKVPVVHRCHKHYKRHHYNRNHRRNHYAYHTPPRHRSSYSHFSYSSPYGSVNICR